MKDYLYIIRGGEDMNDFSADQMQQHLQEWQKWMGGLAQQGKFVAGEPLEDEGKSLVDKGAKVIDRPMAEAKELVAGYLIMKAETLDDAVDLARGCPGLEHDCTIEVREIKGM